MKKLYFLDEQEKNRILNLHTEATKKQYLVNKDVLNESSGLPFTFFMQFLRKWFKKGTKVIDETIYNKYFLQALDNALGKINTKFKVQVGNEASVMLPNGDFFDLDDLENVLNLTKNSLKDVPLNDDIYQQVMKQIPENIATEVNGTIIPHNFRDMVKNEYESLKKLFDTMPTPTTKEKTGQVLSSTGKILGSLLKTPPKTIIYKSIGYLSLAALASLVATPFILWNDFKAAKRRLQKKLTDTCGNESIKNSDYFGDFSEDKAGQVIDGIKKARTIDGYYYDFSKTLFIDALNLISPSNAFNFCKVYDLFNSNYSTMYKGEHSPFVNYLSAPFRASTFFTWDIPDQFREDVMDPIFDALQIDTNDKAVRAAYNSEKSKNAEDDLRKLTDKYPEFLLDKCKCIKKFFKDNINNPKTSIPEENGNILGFITIQEKSNEVNTFTCETKGSNYYYPSTYNSQKQQYVFDTNTKKFWDCTGGQKKDEFQKK